MTGYDNLEQELQASLAALDEKPCGCHETSENPFGEEFSASDDLTTELEFALSGLGGEGETEALTTEEALEFASVAGASANTLDDVISILGQNPGLKITFSL